MRILTPKHMILEPGKIRVETINAESKGGTRACGAKIWRSRLLPILMLSERHQGAKEGNVEMVQENYVMGNFCCRRGLKL